MLRNFFAFLFVSAISCFFLAWLRTHIELEFSKLEDALMNDEITPDQHIKKYNELIEKEAEMHIESFQPHEHI